MFFSAPALRSTFVGRDHDLVALGQLLEPPTVRLVTITGPGGVGKTQLTQELTQQLRESHPGGVPGKVERACARGDRLSFSEVLTRREREVLALIIDGRTDRAIAHARSISVGTASRHVANILHTLDVRTWSAAAAWAIRNGLS